MATTEIRVHGAGGRVTGELTDEHPASSYGVPVLVIAGIPHGPDEALPGSLASPAMCITTAAEYVQWLCPAGESAVDLAERFVRSARARANLDRPAPSLFRAPD